MKQNFQHGKLKLKKNLLLLNTNLLTLTLKRIAIIQKKYMMKSSLTYGKDVLVILLIIHTRNSVLTKLSKLQSLFVVKKEIFRRFGINTLNQMEFM